VPSPGDVLDAQVVVSDYDEATDPLPQTRVGWTFGTGSRIDPGLMGSLMLMAPAQEPPREMPTLPPPPRHSGAPVPGQGYWVELQQTLQSHPPAAVGRDSGPAAEAGGPKRRDALRALERALVAFPRVDHLEYHQRVHRRMLREVAGMVATGLPFLWDYALADVGRRAAEAPPTGLRVFRLPVGGWLVRSDTANFAIDPAGHSIERHLWGALDFVLLTDPRDITKRNDQTLVRLSAARREIYAHQAMHLPGIDASKFPLVQIGQTYASRGLKIHVLGIQEGELVGPTVGYAVEWPDGRTLVHTGCVADDAAVAAALPPGRQVDVLLLSAQHPAARAVGRRIAARVTLLDDVLQCANAAGPDGRVALQEAFDLQMALRPQTTFLLAPGDAVDLGRAGAK
jgi:hypothetical protein